MLNVSSLRSLPPVQQEKWASSLTEQELAALNFDWPFWARTDQLEPKSKHWTTWLILAGRGYGKTRTGAETVRSWAEQGLYERIGLVAETAADARDVIVEGESGILRCSPPWFRPLYEPSKRRLTWPNGVMATLYSGEDPDQLRGPQHHAAWADEVAKWRYAQDAWDQLQFGLRLGQRPVQIVTTTPRPIPLIMQMVKDPLCHVTKGKTLDNAENLAPTFLQKIVARYQGTRLGRQELDAEILEDTPGALWTRDVIDNCRCEMPDLRGVHRIVVAVDPPAAAGEGADACGIVVVALDCDGKMVVIDDATVQGLTPERWAQVVVKTYHRWEASCLVAEVNQGGEMVRSVIQSVDPTIPVNQVRATRGKYVRAEPVAALYEQGKIRHAGAFAALEDQMCNFTLAGMPGGGSPDNLDAMVWAVTELMPSSDSLWNNL